jgi:hypothetical protein
MSILLENPGASYLICGMMGGATGVVELVSRYKDDPMAAVQSIPAVVYILLNVFASVAALLLLQTFGKDLFSESGALETVITQILVAGLGAMAFLRTSIFNVSIGTERVAVGPAALLEVLLSAADRAVDRRRAYSRSASLKKMGWDKISFDKSKVALPAYCFALMQNVSAKEQNAVGEHIKAVTGNIMLTPQQKLRLMVLAIMNIVGEEVLKEAQTGLGSEIEGKDQDAESTQEEAEQKEAAKKKMMEETRKRRENRQSD